VALKADFDSLQRKTVNPFIQLRHWVKYEMIDIEAFQACVESGKEIAKKRKDRATKCKEDQEELDKLMNNKTTLSSIFMKQDHIEKRKLALKEGIAAA
jgi:DNA-directed RNA polymerase delta subunit